MPLLGTFINAGAFSLASGTNCVAHGLPTQPDWVGYQLLTATTSPINLVTRTNTSVNLNNGNTASLQGEVFAIVAHSLIR